MKINLDTLIGAVINCDYRTETYYMACKKYGEPNSIERKEAYDKYNAANDTLFELCQLIGADFNQVYKIGRAARKWEQRNNWQLIFPAMKNYKKIMKYILKTA